MARRSQAQPHHPRGTEGHHTNTAAAAPPPPLLPVRTLDEERQTVTIARYFASTTQVVLGELGWSSKDNAKEQKNVKEKEKKATSTSTEAETKKES